MYVINNLIAKCYMMHFTKKWLSATHLAPPIRSIGYIINEYFYARITFCLYHSQSLEYWYCKCKNVRSPILQFNSGKIIWVKLCIFWSLFNMTFHSSVSYKGNFCNKRTFHFHIIVTYNIFFYTFLSISERCVVGYTRLIVRT